MAARQTRKRPGRTRSKSHPGQLSFFDPAGELPALRREQGELLAQQLHHAEHRRFLGEAVERAEDRARTAAAELDRVQRDVSQVQEAQLDEQFKASIVVGETRRDFHDRREAGAALLAELQSQASSLEQLQTVTGLGTIAGLELCVVAGRAGAELLLSPAIGDPDAVLYTPLEADADFNLKDAPQTVIARFEQILRDLPQIERQWSQSLAEARAEAGDYRRQLEALSAFDGERLEELRDRIAAIESASGGLFRPTGSNGGWTGHHRRDKEDRQCH